LRENLDRPAIATIREPFRYAGLHNGSVAGLYPSSAIFVERWEKNRADRSPRRSMTRARIVCQPDPVTADRLVNRRSDRGPVVCRRCPYSDWALDSYHDSPERSSPRNIGQKGRV
jgi:hypothetical protein